MIRKKRDHEPGAVDGRRLVELRRDLPEARQEDQHRRPELPDRERDQGPDGVVRMTEPAHPRHAHEREHGVHDALGPEHLPPHEGDGHAPGHDRRGVVGRAVHAQAAPLRVQQHRQPEREREAERHRHRDVEEGHADRLEVPAVLREHPLEVLEADPPRRGQDVVVGEREVQRRAHGEQGETDEADQPGRDERVARQVAGADARATPGGALRADGGLEKPVSRNRRGRRSAHPLPFGLRPDAAGLLAARRAPVTPPSRATASPSREWRWLPAAGARPPCRARASRRRPGRSPGGCRRS